MALDPKDLEAIERIAYKASDDVAVSIACSFERLEERIVASEARLYERIAEAEDRVAACEHNLLQDFDSLRSALSS